MKLCSFRAAGVARYGLVVSDGVVDLMNRFQEETLRDFIAGGVARAAQLGSVKADYPLDAIAFDPVIPSPDKIICIGLNYAEHIQETGREQTARPVLFSRFSGSQVGAGQPLIKPLESDEFDYEGELAVIIGRVGRRITKADALTYVAGYACYNDGSIRDWQKHTHQYLPGKTFASTGGFGPWMVTADEIPDPSALTIVTRLNGQVVQNAPTSLMISDVPSLIAYCSTITALLPGDVIVSGTPGGVGARRTPPLWMKDGDVAEVEISGIGILRNPVVAEQ